ncbi:MAG: conjugal transfer protein TraF [Thermoanaerobaculia bacterium]
MRNPASILRFLGSAAVLLAVSVPARAQFPWAGARAMGMGGAEVAAVRDNSATWSNPAVLADLQGWEVQILAGLAAQNRNNLVGSVVDISELPFDEIAAGDAPELVPVLLAHIASVARPGTSVVASGVVGAVVSWKGFALSIGTVPYAGIYPVVDLQHVVPGGGPDDGLEFNQTSLNLAGLSAREARLGYGHNFFGGVLEVGGAARYVSGVSYFGRCGVFSFACDSNDLGDLIQQAFEDNAVTTDKFTFDLGARADFGIVKLGVVGTALNQPHFPVAPVPGAPATVPLPRQFRGGVAVDVLSFLTLAADGDIIPSDTLVPDVESQQISLGAEVKIPLFAFRGGATYDFKSVDPTWAYSLGVGFGVPILSVDLAVLFGPTGGLNPSNPDREALGGSASVRLHF